MRRIVIGKTNTAGRVALKKQFFKWSVGIVRGVFLAGMCFVVLYPFVSKICFSVMTVKDVFNPNITLLPTEFTVKNYRVAAKLLDYWKTFMNTALLSLTTSLAQLLSALMVGYGFARYRFRGRGLLFTTVVIAMVIPPDFLLLSRFFQFRFFDFFGIIGMITGKTPSLIDTYLPFLLLGITCTGLKNGLYIFMLRQFFLGFPKVIEEAAYVDGAGPIKTFIHIILPSSITMAVTVFLFSFVWQWNDSIYSPVFTNNLKLFSTQTALLNSQQAAVLLGTSSTSVAGSLIVNAGVVIIFIPVIILYSFCQKFFVQSIERSGIVG